ncbi:P-loop containing nucleoside triphosphate hydrolase protein [Xylaria bambusicola]|uniref:P-loop containing nucleoside triphosphate hydrolase protein n=1 Tax=Xylaria bambusicola TaxID=326684 RepID=UPI0020086A6E|nr:P-loop containing nucleoside triphosphate hydrolase protein [Xylaria bambusicola]KAI0514477.1 P-loop containing nucleoside triphosphate hydrolase protein [Xylaria bambusicola]
MSDSDEKESMALSEDERQYIRALLKWEPSHAQGFARRRSLSPERPLAGRFRILILGSKGCGKTAILTRFCKDMFAGEGQPPNPEYERGCQRKIEIKEQTYVVDALELEPSQLSEGHYLRHAVAITEAAVLTYDVRSRESFALAQELYQRIHEALVVDERQYYSIVLAGNKADGDQDSRGESYRMVTEGEGYELACHFGGGRTRCAFRETSARTGENVDTLFMLLGTELLKLRQLAQQCQEQANDTPEADDEQTNGYSTNKSHKKSARLRILSLVRRAFGSVARKTAIT